MALATNYLQMAGLEEAEMLQMLREVKFAVRPFVFGPALGLWTTEEGAFRQSLISTILSARLLTQPVIFLPKEGIFGEYALGSLPQKSSLLPGAAKFAKVDFSEFKLPSGETIAQKYPQLANYCAVGETGILEDFVASASAKAAVAEKVEEEPKDVFTQNDVRVIGDATAGMPQGLFDVEEVSEQLIIEVITAPGNRERYVNNRYIVKAVLVGPILMLED